VQSVLEGSIRRAGKRVRIAAQLINTTNGGHLWADRSPPLVRKNPSQYGSGRG
jgi:TolB-like protein